MESNNQFIWKPDNYSRDVENFQAVLKINLISVVF